MVLPHVAKGFGLCRRDRSAERSEPAGKPVERMEDLVVDGQPWNGWQNGHPKVRQPVLAGG